MDHLIKMALAFVLLIKIVGQESQDLTKITTKISTTLSDLQNYLYRTSTFWITLPFFLPLPPQWGSATVQDMSTNQTMPPSLIACLLGPIGVCHS